VGSQSIDLLKAQHSIQLPNIHKLKTVSEQTQKFPIQTFCGETGSTNLLDEREEKCIRT
jgi:hypothetical protein